MVKLKAVARVGIHQPGDEFERDEREAERLVSGGWAKRVVVVEMPESEKIEKKRKG